MPDHGARYTDKQIAELEARLTAMYEQAYTDVREKYMAFVKRFLREDKIYRQKMKDGEIDQETYNAWLRGQVFQRTRWEAQLDDLAQTLTHTTQTAMDIINEAAPGVFAMNANYASYEIERAGNIDMGFGLYDEDTVRRLVRDDPNLLPPSKVNTPLEQQWNKTLINRQIGVGIIAGEGIIAIADRLQRAASMSRNQALTHARTAMTGAQNAGRIEGYHRAESMGIKLEKEWLATLDGHTRRAHAALDGQHVPIDEPFQSLLGEIMYPGDPNARPANVYNCRCTLISHLLEYPSQNAKRRPNLQQLGDDDVQKPIKDMTYAEWAGWKQKQAQPNVPNAPQSIAGKSVDGYTQSQKDEINRLLNAAPDEIKNLFAKFTNQLEEADENVDHGHTAYFDPRDGRVHMHKAEAAAGGLFKPPFKTHFHEYGHNLDHLAGRISTSWRDASGKSFEDIITADWEMTLKNFFKASKANGYMRVLEDQLGKGGMGGDAYIGQMLVEWRRLNGISRDDAQYIALRDELYALDGKNNSFRKYWDKHFDIFGDLAYDNAKIKADTIGYFCDHVQNTWMPQDRADISDMFERYAVQHGGSKYEFPFGVGHGASYALSNGRLASEAFAEMTAASIVLDGSITAIKTYLPNAYNAYLNMLRSVK